MFRFLIRQPLRIFSKISNRLNNKNQVSHKRLMGDITEDDVAKFLQGEMGIIANNNSYQRNFIPLFSIYHLMVKTRMNNIALQDWNVLMRAGGDVASMTSYLNSVLASNRELKLVTEPLVSDPYSAGSVGKISHETSLALMTMYKRIRLYKKEHPDAIDEVLQRIR